MPFPPGRQTNQSVGYETLCTKAGLVKPGTPRDRNGIVSLTCGEQKGRIARGERPEAGLARFAPAGLLADWPVQQVTSVDASIRANHRSFLRNPEGGWRPEAADA